MSFNPVEELKSLVTEIEGKIPTKILDVLDAKSKHYQANGIDKMTRVGQAEYTLNEAAEYLLGMFVGIVEMGKQNQAYYNSFGTWLKHVYHFVIDNNPGLK